MPSSFMILVLVTVALGDSCSDICSLIPGACSSKGSYCKHGDACMDLFWSIRDQVLCNSANPGCSSGSNAIVTCTEAESIVSSRNRSGIRSLVSSSVDVTPRPVVVSTSAPERRVYYQRYNLGELESSMELFHLSGAFMSAVRSISHESGIVERFLNGDAAGVFERFQEIADLLFERMGYPAALVNFFISISPSLRTTCSLSGSVRCNECGYERHNFEHSSVGHYIGLGDRDIQTAILDSLRPFVRHSIHCHTRSFVQDFTSFMQSHRLVIDRYPSLLGFFVTDSEHNPYTVMVPNEIEFPAFEGHAGIIRYRLIGYVRRIDRHTYRTEVANEMSVEVTGLHQILFERL